MCPSNYNRFSDRARYWSKIVIFSYPLAFDATVRGVSVGLAPSRLARKTRMAWLPDGEEISKISLFVLAQLTNVTGGQTDNRQLDGHRMPAIAALYIASHGKNDKPMRWV